MISYEIFISVVVVYNELFKERRNKHCWNAHSVSSSSSSSSSSQMVLKHVFVFVVGMGEFIGRTISKK